MVVGNPCQEGTPQAEAARLTPRSFIWSCVVSPRLGSIQCSDRSSQLSCTRTGFYAAQPDCFNARVARSICATR